MTIPPTGIGGLEQNEHSPCQSHCIGEPHSVTTGSHRAADPAGGTLRRNALPHSCGGCGLCGEIPTRTSRADSTRFDSSIWDGECGLHVLGGEAKAHLKAGSEFE